MAGEALSAEVVAAPIESVAAPAVVEAAAPEPVVLATAPTEAAAVESLPSPEPAAAEVVAEPVAEAPEAEKLEVAPEGEKPPEAGPPTYEAFTLPEGLQADPERLSAFTGLIGKHALTQEAGQELMDLHAAELQRFAQDVQTRTDQRQHDQFAETRAGWRNDFAKQAGNRQNTMLEDAKFAIGEVVKNAEDRKQFWDVLGFTGAGDHPAVIKAWANVGKRLRERAAPATGITPRPQAATPEDRRYGPAQRR